MLNFCITHKAYWLSFSSCILYSSVWANWEWFKGVEISLHFVLLLVLCLIQNCKPNWFVSYVMPCSINISLTFFWIRSHVCLPLNMWYFKITLKLVKSSFIPWAVTLNIDIFELGSFQISVVNEIFSSNSFIFFANLSYNPLQIYSGCVRSFF